MRQKGGPSQRLEPGPFPFVIGYGSNLTNEPAMTRSAKTSLFALVGVIASGLALTAGVAPRQAISSTSDRLEQNFLGEHEVGRRFQVTPSDLPEPKTGRSSPIAR